jgi:hypothetical protein
MTGAAMKVNITVDMTPEEARTFLGLPDVAPLQREMMEQMQARMKAAFDAGDPEGMMRAWMPQLYGETAGIDAFQKFQKALWDSASAVAGQRTDKKDGR